MLKGPTHTAFYLQFNVRLWVCKTTSLCFGFRKYCRTHPFDLYPFHLVSDFGTEFNLEPKMAFVNEIITIKSHFQFQNEFGSKITHQMKWVLDTI